MCVSLVNFSGKRHTGNCTLKLTYAVAHVKPKERECLERYSLMYEKQERREKLTLCLEAHEFKRKDCIANI